MNAILPLTIFRDFQPSSGQKSDRSAGDRARHKAKIKEKIKDGLVDIIAEESLVGKSGDKIIKVPIRSVKEYKFVYGDNPEVGTGDGNAQPGQVIGKKGEGQQQGQGKDKAGDQAGADVYEVEITLDELKEMLFEELQLPNLKKTNKKEIVDKSRAKKDGYRRMGIPVRLDRFRTARERVKRKKATIRHGEEMLEDCEECEGSGWISPNTLSPDIKILCSECAGSGKAEKRFKFRKEDQRFRHMEVKPKPQSNAAIIFILDTSGSMNTQKKFLARSFFFLMYEFIKSKYNRSELVFIAHHTAAKEVTEDEFFHKGESGGTFLSSGLILAKHVIQERYDPSVWNNYVMHMTDGDNFDSDNPATIKGFKDLLKLCSLVGYGEIKPGGSNFYEGSMIGMLKKIPDKNFRIIKIINKTDIWLRLKEVLSLDDKGD